MFIKIKNKQKGMASIMFAMFVVIVVALIATGFAVLVRNDQRQTLDKTLSNQAIYAAESAINKKYRQLTANPTTILPNTTCNADPIVNQNDGVLDASNPGVKISCLLWTATPTALTYDNVGLNPAATPIIPSNNAIQSIKITWRKTSAGGESYYSNTTQLNSVSSVGLPAMPTLKITLAHVASINRTYSVFANPANGGTPSAQSVTNTGDGGIVNGACIAGACEVILKDLPEENGNPWNNGSNQYGWISISSLNGASDVKIEAYPDPNGGGGSSAIPLQGAQLTIDATAKAQDVIKRLQVNISIPVTTWRPGFNISADRLCKNYRVDGANNNQAGTAIGPACP
jgi:Tfp pilus assembly protein PilX